MLARCFVIGTVIAYGKVPSHYHLVKFFHVNQSVSTALQIRKRPKLKISAQFRIHQMEYRHNQT